MRANTVAIIGGGLSGLYAARLLTRAKIDFVLLEAQMRLGGRILSLPAWMDQGAAHSAYDLGPTWYWPSFQARMPKLVRELGLRSVEQPTNGAFLWEDPAKGRQRIDAGAPDNSSMRVDGGLGQLIEALESQLDPKCVLRGHRVTCARLQGDQVELDITDADGSSSRRAFRQVISALPLRLLASSVSFQPALPRAVIDSWSSVPTWMASHAKFVAVYERAFWRDTGLSGQAQSLVGPMAEIHDASPMQGLPALFGFIGVPARLRRSAEEQIKAAALAQLERLFGPQAAAPLFTFYKDWSAEPFVATPDDAAAPRFHPSYGGHLNPPAKWAERFLLAGTEAAPGNGGYLEGALEAAEAACITVLSGLSAQQGVDQRAVATG